MCSRLKVPTQSSHVARLRPVVCRGYEHGATSRRLSLAGASLSSVSIAWAFGAVSLVSCSHCSCFFLLILDQLYLSLQGMSWLSKDKVPNAGIQVSFRGNCRTVDGSSVKSWRSNDEEHTATI